MKNNRVKLYVIWPFLPSDYVGKPRLFCAEFREAPQTFRCDKFEYPDEDTYRAFGWVSYIYKEDIEKGHKLKYAGYPALTPQKAEGRWRQHLRNNLDVSKERVAQIKAALRDFKLSKEVKH